MLVYESLISGGWLMVVPRVLVDVVVVYGRRSGVSGKKGLEWDPLLKCKMTKMPPLN